MTDPIPSIAPTPDAVPLVWLINELDVLIDDVRARLPRAAQETPAEGWQALRAGMRQVAAVLDVAGQPAHARFALELDNWLGLLPQQPAEVAAEWAGPLDLALRLLSGHLFHLSTGAAVDAGQLFPAFRELRQARGAEAHPAELFFPARLPETLPALGPAEAAGDDLERLAALQDHFAAGLAAWDGGDAADGLARMREALGGVEALPSLRDRRLFWWLALAALDALAAADAARRADMAQLPGRIGKQLRKLRVSGQMPNPRGRLTRDLLYFIRHSRARTQRLRAAQLLFFDPPAAPAPGGEAARNLAELARSARLNWLRFCCGQPTSLRVAHAAIDQLHALAPGAAPDALIPLIGFLSSQSLAQLTALSRTEPGRVHVAAALMLVENACAGARTAAADYDAQLHALQRLADPATGADALPEPDWAEWRSARVDVLLAQLGDTLAPLFRQLESLLERYFQSPADAALLTQALGVLDRVASALDAVALADAAALCRHCAGRLRQASTPSALQQARDESAELLTGLAMCLSDLPAGQPWPGLAARSRYLPVAPCWPDAVVPPAPAHGGTLQALFYRALHLPVSEAASALRRLAAEDTPAQERLRKALLRLADASRTAGAFGLAGAAGECLAAGADAEALRRLLARADAVLADGLRGGAPAPVPPPPAPAPASDAAENPPDAGLDVQIGPVVLNREVFRLFMQEFAAHLATFSRFDGQAGAPGADFVRAAHTLRGIARTVRCEAVGDLARWLEEWAQARAGGAAPDAAETGRAARCVRRLADMHDQLLRGEWPQPPAQDDAADGARPAPVASPPEDIPPAPPAVPRPAKSRRAAAPKETPAAIAASGDELASVFLLEAGEIMPGVTQLLRDWRRRGATPEIVNELKRLLHTFKGSARSAGFMDLGEMGHDMESLLDAGAPGGADLLNRLESQSEQIGLRLASLTRYAPAPEPSPGVAESGGAAVGDSFVRVTTLQLDALVNDASEITINRGRLLEDMSGIREALGELDLHLLRLKTQMRDIEIQADSQINAHLSAAGAPPRGFDPLEFDRYTRLQELSRSMAESVNDISLIHDQLTASFNKAENAVRGIGRQAREMQQRLMDVRLVAFSSITDRLRQVVRQIARDSQRQAVLEIVGEDIELDRGLLARLLPSFEHLLRNAVVHGVEPSARRRELGKPETGRIRLAASANRNEIIFELSDDGAGIDLDAVRRRAEEHGLVDPGAALSRQHLVQLIFQPGVTTARHVTPLSGRGIGMDVVGTCVSALGGRIDVVTTPDRGASFTIYLPQTLTTLSVMLLRCGDEVYGLPNSMIEQVLTLPESAIDAARQAGGLAWQNKEWPVTHVARLVGAPAPSAAARNSPVVLLTGKQGRMALQVDAVLGSQDYVLRPLGPQLSRAPGVHGVTIMGDGREVLILNPVALASYVAGRGLPEAPPPAAAASAGTVMVVDDSITVRKVTSNLLQREGFRVLAASDGLEALELLQTERPAVILMDVEMPRMDGFELTRHLRKHAATAGIPILMITSRSADKHRRHAFSLGVNGFLGKPWREDELIGEVQRLLGAAAPAAV